MIIPFIIYQLLVIALKTKMHYMCYIECYYVVTVIYTLYTIKMHYSIYAYTGFMKYF